MWARNSAFTWLARNSCSLASRSSSVRSFTRLSRRSFSLAVMSRFGLVMANYPSGKRPFGGVGIKLGGRHLPLPTAQYRPHRRAVPPPDLQRQADQLITPCRHPIQVHPLQDDHAVAEQLPMNGTATVKPLDRQIVDTDQLYPHFRQVVCSFHGEMAIFFREVRAIPEQRIVGFQQQPLLASQGQPCQLLPADLLH